MITITSNIQTYQSKLHEFLIYLIEFEHFPFFKKFNI